MLSKVKNFFALAFVFSLWCFFAPSAFAEPDPPKPDPPKTLTAEEVAAIVDENKRIKQELEDAKKKNADPPKPDPKDDDLQTKARTEREAKEKATRDAKIVENAITFNLSAEDFVKKNADLLPKDFAEILKIAAKESYDTVIGKAAAIKASMIQSFFGIQANIDSLTPSQKADLDEYLRMTKTAKEDKAATVFANIFEPTLEALRRVKKAEEVGRSRSGLANSTDADSAYKEKLIRGARQTHLGEKPA